MMQSNSEKQNNHSSSEGVYSSYQTVVPLPPYPGDYQTPLHKQRTIVVVPRHRYVSDGRQPIPVTNSLKIFLLLSGFVYALWGILALSVHITIIVHSYSTYYYAVFTGFFLIFGGIIMMIIGLRPSYPLARLTQMYAVDLILCIIGLISSIINYTLSTQCSSMIVRYCDEPFARHLKIGLIITFSVSVIHTAINMYRLSVEERRALLRSNVDVLNY